MLPFSTMSVNVKSKIFNVASRAELLRSPQGLVLAIFLARPIRDATWHMSSHTIKIISAVRIFTKLSGESDCFNMKYSLGLFDSV